MLQKKINKAAGKMDEAIPTAKEGGKPGFFPAGKK